LSIPEEAVQPIGPRTFVFVAEEEGGATVARREEVTLGLRQTGFVEVRSGLEEGERVITEGIIRVRDGGPVKIEDKSILEPEVANRKKASGASSAAPVSPGR
ncbi:MAG: efflux transporter periplasmic adaptor subunit, partial [Henriciella sp.]